MTAVLSGTTSSFSGHGLIDHNLNMADQRGDHDWQQQQQQQQQHHAQQHHGYYGQMPLLSPQYGTPGQLQQNSQQQQYGMAHVDRRVFQDQPSGYMPYATGASTSHGLMSSNYHPGQQWSPNIDLDATASFRSPTDTIASYPSHHGEDASSLQPAVQDSRLPGSIQQHAPSLSLNQQPVKGTRKSSTRTTGAGTDDSDEDLVPDDFQDTNKSTSARGGRKRQRIPHTAVERRYRENLNAHLERLRQTVPSLASRQIQGSSNTDQPTIIESAKPSKCEILNGAIEHIGALDRENQTLKSENKELRTRVDDLNRWYSATLRGGGGYADPGGLGPALQP